MPWKVMKKRYYIELLVLASIGVLITFSSSCTLAAIASFKYDMEKIDEEEHSIGDEPKGMVTSADPITLAWEPPPSAVDTYKVLFRYHDTDGEWFVLGQISAEPDPQFIVFNADVGGMSGDYDFGVKALEDVEESVLHFSLETTADPDTGWFLIWE